MPEQPKTRMLRRDFIKITGVTTLGMALAACAPQPTATPQPPAATPVPPTAVPAATAVPPTAAPTAASGGGGTAAAINWDIYPDTDPRHWIATKDVPYPGKKTDLTLSQNVVTWGVSMKEGEDIDNNVVSKFLKEQTGLVTKAKWSSADPSAQWGTALASGDLPEYMTEIPGQHYVALIEAGKLMDVKDIWTKAATPLANKLKVWPDAPWWKFLQSKGGVYGVAGCWGPTLSSDDVLWVRKDWLDKVGMPFPKTVDEVYATAQAFLKAGLAKVGFAFGLNGFGMWGTLADIFGAYGWVPGMWQKGTDGKLFWSSTHESVKETLGVLAKWYADGIFETDFPKRNNVDPYQAMTDLSVGGLAGIQPAPYWAASSSLAEMKRSQPNVDWAFGDVPGLGPSGKHGRSDFSGAGQINVFLKGTDPAKVEAVIQQMNWFFDIQDASRVGSGPSFKGYDYDIDEQGWKMGGFDTGYIRAGGWEATLSATTTWQTEAYTRLDKLAKEDPDGKTWSPIEKHALADPTGAIALTRDAYMRSVETTEWGQYNQYIYPEPASVSETVAILGPKENETFVRIITGKDPLSAFDTWLADWKANGGDQMTSEINDAFDAYQK